MTTRPNDLILLGTGTIVLIPPTAQDFLTLSKLVVAIVAIVMYCECASICICGNKAPTGKPRERIESAKIPAVLSTTISGSHSTASCDSISERKEEVHCNFTHFKSFMLNYVDHNEAMEISNEGCAKSILLELLMQCQLNCWGCITVQCCW